MLRGLSMTTGALVTMVTCGLRLAGQSPIASLKKAGGFS
jgi:hypothetical protein